MANNIKTIEKIEAFSFMGLLASEGHIPGVIGVPIEDGQRAKDQLFEVVGQPNEKKLRSFKIVRPASWGNKKDGTNFSGGALAH